MTTTSNWTYLGEPITEPLEGMIGFIYRITNLKSGRQYIGQKGFYSKVTKPPLKGSLRRRRSVKESDWQKYWGSSEALKLDILKLGEANFTREILFGCESKSMMNYREIKLQLELDVLLHQDRFYNNIVNIKLNGNQLRGQGGAVLLKKVARQKVLSSTLKS